MIGSVIPVVSVRRTRSAGQLLALFAAATAASGGQTLPVQIESPPVLAQGCACMAGIAVTLAIVCDAPMLNGRGHRFVATSALGATAAFVAITALIVAGAASSSLTPGVATRNTLVGATLAAVMLTVNQPDLIWALPAFAFGSCIFLRPAFSELAPITDVLLAEQATPVQMLMSGGCFVCVLALCAMRSGGWDVRY